MCVCLCVKAAFQASTDVSVCCLFVILFQGTLPFIILIMSEYHNEDSPFASYDVLRRAANFEALLNLKLLGKVHACAGACAGACVAGWWERTGTRSMRVYGW